jgi:alkylhydroperoxidase family enzyme
MARIPYPTPEQLEEETAIALAAMKPMNVFRMLARADSLAPPIFETTTRLFTKGRTHLRPRLRQVAILSVAGNAGFNYLVAHHEPISLKVGLNAQEIAAAKTGKGEGLNDLERAVARFAEESTITGDVSDEAFQAVRSMMDDRELVELSITIGLYNCLGRVLNALRVDIEEIA